MDEVLILLLPLLINICHPASRECVRSLSRITHHARVTQCLGAIGNESWFMAVAAPDSDPDETNMQAFEIPPGVFVKLEVGTWHAGPYFTAPQMDFYNLEHKDTNISDHINKDWSDREFCIVRDGER